MNPAIVVVAYNRLNSLKRLLTSIKNADFFGRAVDLHISIDKGNNEQILSYCNDFPWTNGTKTVSYQKENLGLKKHILQCGDLTEKYEAVILLEDDLYVAKNFYKYACSAADFYKDDARIAGISLYKHSYNETVRLPFYPIKDESDVYFMQLASSWGQVWTYDQWTSFRTWYKKNNGKLKRSNVPKNILKWSDKSWKKYFITYLIDTGKYFVYPQVSLSTNFSDSGGTHISRTSFAFQVPLAISAQNWVFKSLDESYLKYDAYCELEEESFKKFLPQYKDYQFHVDLYGAKIDLMEENQLVLTTLRSRKPVHSFSLRMIPIEMNVLYGVEGEGVCFSKLEDIERSELTRLISYFSLFRVLYKDIPVKNSFLYTWLKTLLIFQVQIKNIILRYLRKLKR